MANGASAGSGPSSSSSLVGGSQISPADLTRVVLDYLRKKGYSRTEAMLRVESANAIREEDTEGLSRELHAAYRNAYVMVRDWVERSLDLYKPELRRFLYPIFVHSFLDLVSQNSVEAASNFYEEFSGEHEAAHASDLQELRAITLPEHAAQNHVALLFRNKKYRLSVSRTVFDLLLHHLHEVDSRGSIPIRFLNEYISARISSTGPSEGEMEQEGIEGHDVQQTDQVNSEAVSLGQMPMDEEMEKDLSAEVAEEEAQIRAAGTEEITMPNTPSLSDALRQIKREATEDSPSKELIPLPP